MSKNKRLIKNNLTKTITTTVIATGVYVPFCLSTVYAEEIKTVDKQTIETKSEESGIIGWGLEDKDGNVIEGYGSEKKKVDEEEDSISKSKEIKSIDKDSTNTNKSLSNDYVIGKINQNISGAESKKADEKYPETGIVGWGLEDKDGNVIEGHGSEKKKVDEKEDRTSKLGEINSTDKYSEEATKPLQDDQGINGTTQYVPKLEVKKVDEPFEKGELEAKIKLTNQDNSYTYKNEKEEDIKTVWVKGITPPRMGGNGDFTKEIVGTKKYYVTSQDKGNGWYDVNKLTGNLNINDFALCGGATASNMLHWWLEQNKDYVDKFIKENPKNGILEFNGEKKGDIRDLINSYDKEKHSSEIFNLFKEYFGRQRKGIWADTTIDMFINGYIPSLTGENRGQRNDKNKFITSKKDHRGGFFRDVFKEEILTERDKINSYEDLSELVKKRLGEGRVLAISHMMGSNIAHIVTVWGADYDSNENLKGLYLSDSDDYSSMFKDENNNNKKYSMKRYNVENKDGKLRLSTEKEEGFGVKVLDLYSLSLGKDTWSKYFENSNVDKNLELVKKELGKSDSQNNAETLEKEDIFSKVREIKSTDKDSAKNLIEVIKNGLKGNFTSEDINFFNDLVSTNHSNEKFGSIKNKLLDILSSKNGPIKEWKPEVKAETQILLTDYNGIEGTTENIYESKGSMSTNLADFEVKEKLKIIFPKLKEIAEARYGGYDTDSPFLVLQDMINNESDYNIQDFEKSVKRIQDYNGVGGGADVGEQGVDGFVEAINRVYSKFKSDEDMFKVFNLEKLTEIMNKYNKYKDKVNAEISQKLGKEISNISILMSVIKTHPNDYKNLVIKELDKNDPMRKGNYFYTTTTRSINEGYNKFKEECDKYDNAKDAAKSKLKDLVDNTNKYIDLLKGIDENIKNNTKENINKLLKEGNESIEKANGIKGVNDALNDVNSKITKIYTELKEKEEKPENKIIESDEYKGLLKSIDLAERISGAKDADIVYTKDSLKRLRNELKKSKEIINEKEKLTNKLVEATRDSLDLAIVEMIKIKDLKPESDKNKHENIDKSNEKENVISKIGEIKSTDKDPVKKLIDIIKSGLKGNFIKEDSDFFNDLVSNEHSNEEFGSIQKKLLDILSSKNGPIKEWKPEMNKPEMNKPVKLSKKQDNLTPKTGDSSVLGFAALGFSGLLGLVLNKIKFRKK